MYLLYHKILSMPSYLRVSVQMYHMLWCEDLYDQIQATVDALLKIITSQWHESPIYFDLWNDSKMISNNKLSVRNCFW